jgi:hypothetical protein
MTLTLYIVKSLSAKDGEERGLTNIAEFHAVLGSLPFKGLLEGQLTHIFVNDQRALLIGTNKVRREQIKSVANNRLKHSVLALLISLIGANRVCLVIGQSCR